MSARRSALENRDHAHAAGPEQALEVLGRPERFTSREGTGLVAVPVEGEPSRELALVWRKGTARGPEFRLLAKALTRV